MEPIQNGYGDQGPRGESHDPEDEPLVHHRERHASRPGTQSSYDGELAAALERSEQHGVRDAEDRHDEDDADDDSVDRTGEAGVLRQFCAKHGPGPRQHRIVESTSSECHRQGISQSRSGPRVLYGGGDLVNPVFRQGHEFLKGPDGEDAERSVEARHPGGEYAAHSVQVVSERAVAGGGHQDDLRAEPHVEYVGHVPPDEDLSFTRSGSAALHRRPE